MPRLSVVVLTWNEARCIEACLASLARQTTQDHEVIVVDAASTDGTLPKVLAAKAAYPVPLKVHVTATKVPIGTARNLGLGIASADRVAFLSADAEAEPHWVEETLATLDVADLAFSRQLHDPFEWTVGAAVRGLRYHFPATTTHNPLALASNVAAGYRRVVLERFPFDPEANAAEDLLIAKRAAEAGYISSYNPRMVVRHHDVATARQEWRKSVREGAGTAVHRDELGPVPGVLPWGAALALCALVAVLNPPIGVPLLLLGLLAPALRRAWRHRADMPPGPLVLGVVASPVFDTAFLACHAGTLGRARLGPMARRAGRWRRLRADAQPARQPSTQPAPPSSTPSTPTQETYE